ncbi:MAG: S8 family peptidase, partial [Bacteroidota bacterium]
KEISLSKDLNIVRRLDNNHFIVLADQSALESVKFWKVNNEWKLLIDPKSPGDLFYIIGTKRYRPKGLEVINEYRNIFLVRLNLNRIKSLLTDPEIISISNKVSKPKTETRVIDLNLNPNRVNKIHHFYPELDGNSELVSIQENSYQPDDIDLVSRNVETGFESTRFDNHANEMATIIAGAGNSFITGRGVATRANITSSDFFSVLPNEDSYYFDNGILTQNHSYGIEQDTLYQAEAVAFDLSSYNNRNLLHVFSSGNEGNTTAPGGVYEGIEGFSNLTGDIKMTKNSLVVGSVDTLGNEILFSSRGPTYDGRVKPEVVAYSMVGSSNSAALASGVSVLLQQEYRNTTGGDLPSALAKALLINSATDVGSPGLDYVTGYGSIDAFRSLSTLKDAQYFRGSVSQSEIENFNLNIPINALNLKVTICWTDPPANAGDAIALVNDLDLRLVDGGSNTTLPWVLDNVPSELSSLAARSVDRLNNIEQITLDNPETTYTIEVEGTDVVDSQEFFIAYQYDLGDSFEWDYPTGSDNMTYNGDTGSYFRWNTTFQGSATLDYSIDNGQNWLQLNNAIELSRGYWRWNNPSLEGDSAIARMTIGADTFTTDVFTLSAPLDASVGFNCGDSLMLRWQTIPKASDYTIFRLGELSLEEITTVEDTFIVINNKSSLLDERLTIQPNLSNNKNLLPAPTFDYTLQGIDCYIFSFFQTLALDTGFYLNLTLGTTKDIDRITFQRNNLSNYVDIGSIENPDREEISFLDDNPTQGYNEHRVVIDFINGEQLIMSAGASFYLTEIPVRVFPNPVEREGFVQIITKEFGDSSSVFELIDSKGALILSKTIFGTLDFAPLTGLDPGIYYYRLIADGEVFNGRVIIR